MERSSWLSSGTEPSWLGAEEIASAMAGDYSTLPKSRRAIPSSKHLTSRVAEWFMKTNAPIISE
eukprot:12922218-Prorocentrum_lima.AAC.1